MANKIILHEFGFVVFLDENGYQRPPFQGMFKDIANKLYELNEESTWCISNNGVEQEVEKNIWFQHGESLSGIKLENKQINTFTLMEGRDN